MEINKIKFTWQEYLELIFKISYILLAFATYVTVLYMSSAQSIFVKLTMVLGALIILVRIIHWKDYIKTPGLILMALMCASFLLSTVMNREYGMTDNLKWLIWMGIQFFGLYAMPLKREKSHVIFEYKIISSIVLVATVVGSIASMKMLSESYSEFLTTADGELIITGFTWDRLWGVYTDPNYGALISVIGIFIALGWVIISRRVFVKILCLLAAVADYGYVIFADSRTSHVALILGVFFLIITLFAKKIKEKDPDADGKKHIAGIVVSMLVLVLLAGSIYGGGYVWKEHNIQYQEQVAKELEEAERQVEAKKQEEAKKAAQNANKNTTTTQNSNKNSTGSTNKNTGASKNTTEEKVVTEREKQLNEDASNGRLSLWKSAIEVWESSPIYGTGYSTFSKYAEENVPTTYAVDNAQGVYTSLHNEFFNVLAYQGALGAIIFVLMILRLMIYVIRGVFLSQGEKDFYPVPMLCCVGTVVVGMVFLLDGLYTNSVSAAVLWIFGGYLVNLAGHGIEAKCE